MCVWFGGRLVAGGWAALRAVLGFGRKSNVIPFPHMGNSVAEAGGSLVQGGPLRVMGR